MTIDCMDCMLCVLYIFQQCLILFEGCTYGLLVWTGWRMSLVLLARPQCGKCGSSILKRKGVLGAISAISTLQHTEKPKENQTRTHTTFTSTIFPKPCFHSKIWVMINLWWTFFDCLSVCLFDFNIGIVRADSRWPSSFWFKTQSKLTLFVCLQMKQRPIFPLSFPWTLSFLLPSS